MWEEVEQRLSAALRSGRGATWQVALHYGVQSLEGRRREHRGKPASQLSLAATAPASAPLRTEGFAAPVSGFRLRPRGARPEMSNEGRKPDIDEEWVLRREQSGVKQDRICNHAVTQAAESAPHPDPLPKGGREHGQWEESGQVNRLIRTGKLARYRVYTSSLSNW